MIKEKPIIFSTPMIQAILNTEPGIFPPKRINSNKPFKAMTRRVIKPQPDDYGVKGVTVEGFQTALEHAEEYWINTEEGESVQIKPKYEKGDILWVRETWRVSHVGISGNEEWAHIVYKEGEGKTITINNEQSLFYTTKAKWQSPYFLRREASRILLKVTDVGIQRLQEISKTGAILEGSYLDRCKCVPKSKDKTAFDKLFQQHYCHIHGTEYKKLWDSINAKRGYSWESNPWVWVYEFMRIK